MLYVASEFPDANLHAPSQPVGEVYVRGVGRAPTSAWERPARLVPSAYIDEGKASDYAELRTTPFPA